MKRRSQIPPNSQPDSSAGSPQSGEPVYLAVGRMRRPHGVKGEIVMEVLTDFPERLKPGKTLFVGEAHEPLQLAGIRGHAKEMILKLVGFDTPEEVGRLRKAVIYIKADELPKLPEGEYYHHELLGLAVVDEAGQKLGELFNIIETGANDVYVVKTPEGKELLLPAVEDFVLEVNLEKGEILVRPPDYL